MEINATLSIPDDELLFTFARSGGPGGQNVNKVASKAVMRWNVTASPSLPDEIKARFLQQQHTRITVEGELVLTGQRFRDQEKNREDCLEKLRGLIVKALTVPKPRRVTKPSRSSKRRRVEDKRRHSAVKGARRKPSEE